MYITKFLKFILYLLSILIRILSFSLSCSYYSLLKTLLCLCWIDHSDWPGGRTGGGVSSICLSTGWDVPSMIPENKENLTTFKKRIKRKKNKTK